MRGHLLKKTLLNKNEKTTEHKNKSDVCTWKRVYCETNGSYLSIFKNSTKAKMVAVISMNKVGEITLKSPSLYAMTPLTDLNIVSIDDKFGDAITFELDLKENRLMFLRASNPVEALQWIHHLNSIKNISSCNNSIILRSGSDDSSNISTISGLSHVTSTTMEERTIYNMPVSPKRRECSRPERKSIRLSPIPTSQQEGKLQITNYKMIIIIEELYDDLKPSPFREIERSNRIKTPIKQLLSSSPNHNTMKPMLSPKSSTFLQKENIPPNFINAIRNNEKTPNSLKMSSSPNPTSDIKNYADNSKFLVKDDDFIINIVPDNDDSNENNIIDSNPSIKMLYNNTNMNNNQTFDFYEWITSVMKLFFLFVVLLFILSQISQKNVLTPVYDNKNTIYDINNNKSYNYSQLRFFSHIEIIDVKNDVINYTTSNNNINNNNGLNAMNECPLLYYYNNDDDDNKDKLEMMIYHINHNDIKQNVNNNEKNFNRQLRLFINNWNKIKSGFKNFIKSIFSKLSKLFVR